MSLKSKEDPNMVVLCIPVSVEDKKTKREITKKKVFVGSCYVKKHMKAWEKVRQHEIESGNLFD